MLTQYAADIPLSIAFPPASLENTYGEWLSKAGKTQLRISETEKYAHVTFFFNGGVENEFDGEERQLVASPKVATYDLQPEMSSEELTEKMVAAINLVSTTLSSVTIQTQTWLVTQVFTKPLSKLSKLLMQA